MSYSILLSMLLICMCVFVCDFAVAVVRIECNVNSAKQVYIDFDTGPSPQRKASKQRLSVVMFLLQVYFIRMHHCCSKSSFLFVRLQNTDCLFPYCDVLQQ